MKWRYATRKIDGVRRKVKISKGGRYVRMVGYKNYSDRTRVGKRKKYR